MFSSPLWGYTSVPNHLSGKPNIMKDVSVTYDLEKCQQYLNERGFPRDPRIRDMAGIEFAGATRCYAALGKRQPPKDERLGVIFHYPQEDYATVRWMGTYLNAWGQVCGADRKMECPATKHPPCYVPSIVDWDQFDGTLYLCESALKALVLSTRGYAAIGGNGTFGLYNRNGWPTNFPHDMLTGITRVAILFDNDYKGNHFVRLAIRRLGHALAAKHPTLHIYHKPLPDPPVGSDWWHVRRGKHAGIWGVDDYIASTPEADVRAWLDSDSDIQEIESSELQAELDLLNDQYTVCRQPEGIIDVNTTTVYSSSSFCSLIEAPRIVFDPKGKPISVPKCWVRSKERTMVERMVYLPGGQQLVQGDYYNSWSDTGVVPEPPPEGYTDTPEAWIAPFIAVYRNAIPDPLVRGLTLQSLAYMLQARGVRLTKTFLFVSTLQGTGKSLLVKIMGRCVGRTNFSSIGVEDFTDNFNSGYASSEVVLLDDLYQLPKPAAGKLKRAITDETVLVNTKSVKQYKIDNMAVYFVTSNEYISLPLDDNDRRVVAVDFTPTTHYLTGTDYWNDFADWLEHAGGYGKVRWWLEQLDLTDYDPNFMPPMTETKQSMVQAVKTPEELWISDLYKDPAGTLYGNQRSVYTMMELWTLYTESGVPPTSGEKRRFTQALARTGFKQANAGKPVRVAGKLARYWVCNGRGKDWGCAPVQADILKHSTLVLC